MPESLTVYLSPSVHARDDVRRGSRAAQRSKAAVRQTPPRRASAWAMFLRFTLLEKDTGSGRKRGLFVAAHELRDSDKLSADEHRVLQEALKWFNQNLNVPTCLRLPENRRALSWFKPKAKAPLSRMWALVEIMKAHGYQVELHKTQTPGHIVFEDGWQVVAKPVRGRREAW